MNDIRSEVLLEGRRAATRFRTLGVARLVRADQAGRTPSDQGLEVCQRLADLAADAAGRQRRTVARVEPHAAGDQLALLANDIVTEGNPDALAAALAALISLRRIL